MDPDTQHCYQKHLGPQSYMTSLEESTPVVTKILSHASWGWAVWVLFAGAAAPPAGVRCNIGIVQHGIEYNQFNPATQI